MINCKGLKKCNENKCTTLQLQWKKVSIVRKAL